MPNFRASLLSYYKVYLDQLTERSRQFPTGGHGQESLAPHPASGPTWSTWLRAEQGIWLLRAARKCLVMHARVLMGSRAKFSERQPLPVWDRKQEGSGDWLRLDSRLPCMSEAQAFCVPVCKCSLCWVLAVFLLGVRPAGICFPSFLASLSVPFFCTPVVTPPRGNIHMLAFPQAFS